MAKRQLRAAMLIVALFCGEAHADGRTTFLVDRLKSDDFRVRTNAALALGATNDDAAVQPLCNSLNDGNDVVRQSAAAALKRLGKPAGVGCLKARLAVEGNADVKLQLTRAIEGLEGGGGGGVAPHNVANAKFYVAVVLGNSNSDRNGNRALSAITSKLDSIGGYQLAPRAETPDAARGVISRRNLKGFYLSVSLEVSEAGGGLKALVRIAVFSYPGRDLRGEVAPYAIVPGGHRGDSQEDSLVQAVAERAAEQFTQNFQ